ncbi:PLP-dependent aminotransferase family protein [Gluconacetobacter tumulisoli]|uniref:PLP-dependent aminotransferase family protein n=1 Tax=Gluconacetobacter tumulisoli TaxID=1286189 RepID=A0A7W4K4S0_9PROT|nr:PLP-dependent aminotransferase family protein [Gluconacetobacter tumulisoli]MBB2200346.1 PLP-dependent aminotransferase family protein [Gluconacetobacter tumulisoli]
MVLDRSAGALEAQIHRTIRDRILGGQFAAGDRLPSSRALAAALGLARSTIVQAYERLRAEGFLEARGGSATRIAALPSPPPHGRAAKAESPPPGQSLSPDNPAPGAFQPGLPDLTSFPHAAWARCLGARARSGRTVELGYGLAAGTPELRAAILSHVAVTRGVVATVDRVVVVPSTRMAIDVIARVVLQHPGTPGSDVAWVEDPGYPTSHALLRAAGARLVPVACDAHGMDVARADGPPPRLISVTPSHQYPTGATMTLQRRLAVLGAAQASGAVILEDDYDSEFQYGSRPIAALQGIDRTESVAYLGTFSKILVPGLHVAYAILPAWLAPRVAAALRMRGTAVPVHVQLALADFLNDGHLRAHVRRMGALYAARMAATVAALRRHCADILTPGTGEGGLQLAAWFTNPAMDDRAVVRALNARGLAIRALSDFHLGPARPGLLLGIASATDDGADRAARHIRAAVDRS